MSLKVQLRAMLAISVFFVFAAAQSTAFAAKRLALVIGNAEYTGKAMAPLKNPVNDATLIADSLKKTGFTVELVTNADLKNMKRSVSRFTKEVEAAGPDAIALFYYSGHGFQANNINYLAPLNADLQDEVDAEFEAMSVDWVLARMQAAHKGANIVILDACRNTALSRSVRSLNEGLALLTRTPTGSFISYATAPGSTALDGAGLNSPYTSAIARELIQPGATIEQAFKNVRRSVVDETAGAQVPWDYSSLTTDIVFVPSDDLEAVALSTGRDTTEMEIELQFWNDVKDSTSANGVKAYLDKYPEGAFAGLAKAKIDELEAGSTGDQKIDQLFAKLTSRALIVEKPTRPHEFYANARMREIQGDYPKARQDYLKFFAFGEEKIDPHYRFQSFLRIQEGRAGAREFYRTLSQGQRDRILLFAAMLLGEREQRLKDIAQFIKDNPEFAPAYYELSQDFSLARLGQQSLADKKAEFQLLKKFVALVEDGQFLKYFFDQQMAALQVEDAKTRLAALSFLDTAALENPVKLNATRSNQGWMMSISIADQATEIFVEHSGQPPASTGFLPGAVNPTTGKPVPFPSFELPGNAKPMNIKVSYLDVRGQFQGPFEVAFDPALALVAGQKMILDRFATGWISYRDYDGKLLAYFSHLVSYRCAIERIEYSIDSEDLDRTFDLLPCDPNDPHSINFGKKTSKIHISIPRDSSFMSVRLMYRDGTESDLKRFEVVR
ncbi:MAG: caspase family protein [Pseudomonadota bacterium]